MKLIRELATFPQLHIGPHPGGTFWALKGHNDLPRRGRMMEAELDYLLRCGQVWIQSVTRPDGWIEIKSRDDLPQFSSRWVDDYNACTSRAIVSPFMPEFYFIPFSWRGQRFLRRAERRAK